MAALTQKDTDNYNKLKEAFEKLNILNSDNTPISANDSISSINTRIEIGTIPANTETLSNKIDLIDIFSNVVLALDKKIIFVNKGGDASKIDIDEKLKINNEKFKQQFSDAIEELKSSLQGLADESINLTKGIEDIRPDFIFLEFVEKSDIPISTPSAKSSTEILIKNDNLRLNERQTELLIAVWRTAINAFVDDARKKNEKKGIEDGKITPFTADTFAHFFRIHKELEILYGKLAETEIFQ